MEHQPDVRGGDTSGAPETAFYLPDIEVSLTPDLTIYRDLAVELATRPWLDAVSVYWRGVGPALIDAAGVQRVLGTVDHPHIAARLLAGGVHGLTSNNLKLLVNLGTPRQIIHPELD